MAHCDAGGESRPRHQYLTLRVSACCIRCCSQEWTKLVGDGRATTCWPKQERLLRSTVRQVVILPDLLRHFVAAFRRNTSCANSEASVPLRGVGICGYEEDEKRQAPRLEQGQGSGTTKSFQPLRRDPYQETARETRHCRTQRPHTVLDRRVAGRRRSGAIGTGSAARWWSPRSRSRSYSWSGRG